MRKTLALILALSIGIGAFAQKNELADFAKDKPESKKDTTPVGYYHDGYDWDTTITLVALSDSDNVANAVILLDNRIIEFAEEPDGDEDEYYMYVTKHKRIRVNTDKGVDEWNKVFVPVADDDEVITLKARSIAKDGTVKILNEESIKNLDNYEDYGNFAIFAIEGVEKGGEIEYLYTIKRGVDVLGRETYQNDAPIKLAKFTLVTDDDLKFATYGYNGFPSGEFVREGDKYVLTVTVKDIEALYEEDYSGYDASKKKIAYKLVGRKNKDSRFYTWNDAAQDYIDIIYASGTSFNAEKFLKEHKITKLKTIEEQILAIENYLKTNITIKDESGVVYSDPARIVVQKYGNETGLTRIYGMCLYQLGIKHQLVVSCNRYDSEFVADFEDYYNLDEYLIYIPELKKYVSPGNIHLRLGPAPSYLAGNNGLFVTVPYGFGQVRQIPVMDYKDNTVAMEAEIVFNKDMEQVRVKKEHSWTGHTAYSYRLNFEYADETNKEEFVKELLASGIDDAVIVSKQTSDAKLIENATDKPLILNGEYTTSELLENAGNSYILKVGDIIGPQAELYQEHERQTDIQFPYPKQYLHHIYFTIPDGYTVKGLDDVVIEKVLTDKGEVQASFKSSYKIEGNVVHINILEMYANPMLPKKLYEGFRSVINAASDFNKVVLLLEPKQ